MVNLIEPIFLNHSVHISKSLIKPHDIAKKLGIIFVSFFNITSNKSIFLLLFIAIKLHALSYE